MKLKKLFAGILTGAMVVGCMIMPSNAATGDVTVGSFQGQVAFCGFDSSWGGWDSVYTSAGELELSATVQEIMDVNGIADIDDFGGFIFQIWNAKEGDTFEYTLSINNTVDESETWTYTSGNSDIKQLQDTSAWGSYEFAATDEITATVTLTSYTATPTYEISSEYVDAYSEYTVDFKTSDGKTGSITGNTYAVDSETGTYTIGINLTDVPGDVTVEITNVTFTPVE